MTLTRIGTIISAVGYVLAIYGGWILYKNAAPEHGFGTIPVLHGKTAMIEHFDKQKKDIEKRQFGNDVGFGLLTAGGVLQLIGTLVAGFSS